MHPGNERLEVEGGRYRVGEADSLNAFDLPPLIAKIGEHHLTLIVAELEPRDLLGAGNRLLGELRPTPQVGPERTWQQRRAEAHAAEVGHEPPPIYIPATLG
jgi:hypothetical protein